MLSSSHVCSDILPESSKDSNEKSITHFHTLTRSLLILTLILIKIVGDAGVSLYFPLYPTLAEGKGVSSAEVGLVIGLYPFTSFLIFPAVGIIMMYVDKKTTIIANGILMCGILILYGFIERMPRLSFEIYSFIFPVFIGIAQSFISIAIFVILWALLPENRTLMISIFEVAISLGYFLGPAIGGVLSDLVGFFYMYLITGLIGLTLVFLIIFLFYVTPLNLSLRDRNSRSSFLIIKLISHPRVLLYLSIMFLSAFFYTFSLPIIGPYLRGRYGVGSATIGLIMMLPEIVYMVSALFLGFMFDRGYFSFLKTFSSLGILIQGISLFFFSPSSLLFSQSEDLLIISFIANIMNGLGCCISIIPTSAIAIKFTVDTFPGRDGVEGLMEGLLQGAWYLGEALGPIAGGILIGFYVYDTLLSLMSLLSVIVSVAILFLSSKEQISNFFKSLTGHYSNDI